MKEAIKRNEEGKIRNIDTIKKIVCHYYGFSDIDMFEKNRKAEVIQVKYMIYYFMDLFKIYNKLGISKMFDANHATVLHAIKKIKNTIEVDKDFRDEVRELTLEITKEAKIGAIQMTDENYFINLNNCFSLKLDKEKSIVFSGFTDDEVYAFKENVLSLQLEHKKHTGTNLFILE